MEQLDEENEQNMEEQQGVMFGPIPPGFVLAYDVRVGAAFEPPIDAENRYRSHPEPIPFRKCKNPLVATIIPEYQFQSLVNLAPAELVEHVWELTVYFTNEGLRQLGSKVRPISYVELKAVFGIHQIMNAWGHNPTRRA